MPKKVTKVSHNPGGFRLSFTKRELDMMITGLRRIQSQRPGPTAQKQLPKLISRLQHAKRKIDEQLDLYRKVNNLERCELWDLENQYTRSDLGARY